MVEPRKRITFVCEKCGSDLVTRDAWAEWNVEDQDWVLGDHKCEAETHLAEVELKPEPQD